MLPISTSKPLRAGKAVHPCEVNVEDIDSADDIAVPRSFASLADQNTVYFARHLCWIINEFTVLVVVDAVSFLHALILGLSRTAYA